MKRRIAVIAVEMNRKISMENLKRHVEKYVRGQKQDYSHEALKTLAARSERFDGAPEFLIWLKRAIREVPIDDDSGVLFGHVLNQGLFLVDTDADGDLDDELDADEREDDRDPRSKDPQRGFVGSFVDGFLGKSPPEKAPLRPSWSAALIHLFITGPDLTDHYGNPSSSERILFEEGDADLKQEMIGRYFIETANQGWCLSPAGAIAHLKIREFAIKWGILEKLTHVPAPEMGGKHSEFRVVSTCIEVFSLEKILFLFCGENSSEVKWDQTKGDLRSWVLTLVHGPEIQCLSEGYRLWSSSSRNYQLHTPSGDLVLGDSYDAVTGCWLLTVSNDFILELSSLCGWT
jgi:hypothetical protein